MQKNIVSNSTITAGGNVHIGDIIYNITDDFQSGSVLFLRLDKSDENHYWASLSVKSKHSSKGKLASAGETWYENIAVNIPPQLFAELQTFQTFRRNLSLGTRHQSYGPDPSIMAMAEQYLGRMLFDTFFTGPVGDACRGFMAHLKEQRIEELILAISCDDAAIINLPFEMALPHLWGSGGADLGVVNFGLIRTKTPSLEKFNMQGSHNSAAPLKMLFITALPENTGEGNKMLQIEEEQSRLIRAIGALEATGDKKPKIVIEFLENASLTELDKALTLRHHDIVHISGHGAYKQGEQKGVLFFENEEGNEAQITGEALGEVLVKHNCVKLLILSACETAIAGSEGGVTEQVTSYVPAVLAMRFAITDEGAKIFTTDLYTHLANGDTLTQSVAYARTELLKWVNERRQNAPLVPHIAEWFTPVVYQNQSFPALINNEKGYHLPDRFYPHSSFLKTKHSRLIGEGFIGRKTYLIQMRQAFRERKHVVVQGLGGLGKTTLAEAFAHNYDNRNHKVIIFRNGAEINEKNILDTLNEHLAEVKPALSKQIQKKIDDPETELDEKLQYLIDNYLKDDKFILIFDNFEDLQQDQEGNIQGAIASPALSSFMQYFCQHTPPDCHLIFTTRYAIPDLESRTITLALNKMGFAEQYRLLNYSETLRTIPLTERESVYRRLDGHPRGYEYLEALLKNDLSFRWEHISKVEADIFENLLLAKVHERLTEAENTVFQYAAVFISRTPLAALAHVSGIDEAELLPVLHRLQAWSLCVIDQENHFDIHRLTREWALQNIIPTGKRKESALGAATYFKAQPTWADEILAKDYFEIAEDWDSFADTSFAIQNHYQLIGFNPQALELNKAVLEKCTDNEKAISQALSNTGLIFNLYGQYDKALELYEQSIQICRKIDDREDEGTTLSHIGLIYSVKGDYDTALRFLEQSLAISQEIGNRQGEGTTLNNLATTAFKKGDYDTALRFLEQSLAILQQIGDRQGEGTALNNISLIHKVIGDYDTALRFLEQSLAIRQQIGDRQGEGTALNNISQIYSAKGDYDTALRFLEQSLPISQQIGDRQGEGTTLNNISQIYHNKGDYDTALRFLEQSLAISQQIGDRRNEGGTLNNISQIYFAKGDYDTALPFLEQSLAIQKQIGDRKGEGTTLNNISQIYYRKGYYDNALRFLEQSLAITQQIGDIAGMANTMGNMGVRFFKKEQYKEAIPLLLQAYQIFDKIGSPDKQSLAGYLNAIIQRIGEAKFQEILSQLP